MAWAERSQDEPERFSATVISEAIRTCANEQDKSKSEIWVAGGDCTDLVDGEAQCCQQCNQTYDDVHMLLPFNVLKHPCLCKRRLKTLNLKLVRRQKINPLHTLKENPESKLD